MYQGLLASTGMGVAFVPLTFPTVMFTSLAKDMGFSFSWGEVDDIWNAYYDGRASGAISKPGETTQAIDVVSHATWARPEKVRQWFSVARAAAKKWWGDTGIYFADFGGKTFTDAIGDNASAVVKSVVTSATDIGKKIGKGVADGLGIPRWILWGVVTLSAVLALYLVFKFRYPKVSLS